MRWVISTGTGELTANYPGAVAFEKDGATNPVVYNFSNQVRTVTLSNGKTYAAPTALPLTSTPH